MKSRSNAAPAGAPRVLIASTAMLAFFSFWQAAAVVLNDMGSSAFYAGAIAEHFIGKTAPWFILAIMILSFAVRSLYIESCSMFVRGGVYRVVKEAMGATLAKFSVSALMFDYVLTGPISGVSAGLYLVGLMNEILAYFHSGIQFPVNWPAALFAILVTLQFYFPSGRDQIFYLGPHAPHLTPKEIDLLHGIWLELSSEVAPDEIHHHDVVHFALEELQDEMSDSKRKEVVSRLRQHLQAIKNRRAPSLR